MMSWVYCVNGQFLVCYMRDVKQIIQLYNKKGEFVKDFPAPTIGTISSAAGKWNRN